LAREMIAREVSVIKLAPFRQLNCVHVLFTECNRTARVRNEWHRGSIKW